MQSFHVPRLLAEQQASGRAYGEFLRELSMSIGLYHLAPGQSDLQNPHTEDEVYYVLAGRATFHYKSQKTSASPGDLLFVEKHAPHRFTDIIEPLTLLVFFAPAEGTGRGS